MVFDNLVLIPTINQANWNKNLHLLKFKGYKSVQYSLDVPDITKQMVGGIILALIVAIADFYFLFKKLLRLDSDYEQQQQQQHNQKSEVNKKKISNKEQRKSKIDKKKD